MGGAVLAPGGGRRSQRQQGRSADFFNRVRERISAQQQRAGARKVAAPGGRRIRHDDAANRVQPYSREERVDESST